MRKVPLSVLDLAPVVEGGDAAQAFRNSLDLAQHAEAWGYQRYWLAEHHNMPGIASAATSVVMGFIAQGTRTIRVGAGGVMLPNHSPLVIAEQFGTLASLYPGRIDLGVGRAPGTDGLTSRALRRDASAADTFPDDVQELLYWFSAEEPGQKVRAVPGAGLDVPVWVLGSSLFGASLAAALGLPYAFASHFAPAALDEALALYRARYQPSSANPKPHVMVAFNVIAADSDAEAQRLFTSVQRGFINLRRGMPGKLQPPVDALDLAPADVALLDSMLVCRAVGAPATVREKVDAFLERTQPDELIVTSQVFDHAARLRSFELLAEVMRK
ncbi:MAG: LLM class flavin-dependent oxidoreductase [Labilithrix sp.]|nr:LLM class flavin-dependent oxidoreductase [Labilithrix sp.]